ncbi:MAG: DUF2396 family protein, partial [Cyanobacteria bacterium J06632_3]
RATRVIIAERYQRLMSPYLEHGAPWQSQTGEKVPKLYGLPVSFSESPDVEPRWAVVNFDLEKEPGVPTQYRYLKIFE